jgi:protein phosphatase
MDYRIEAACGSSVGKVRSNNEDNFLFDGTSLPKENRGQLPPLKLYGEFPDSVSMAVFDGMGGMDHGEAASATAAESVKRLLEQMEKPSPEALEDICLQANRAVWQKAVELGTERMGTTLAMLCFEKTHVYAINVGDSRIFGLRGERLVQISRDHTDEAYMKAKGIVGRKPRLTQYMGIDPGEVRLEPYITKGSVQTGDIYLICSDGLTDMLDEDTICQILAVSGTAAACVEGLIGAALEQGGRDNVTVTVCRILEQTNSERMEENDRNASQSPVARLGGLGASWGRKLWSSIQDTAKHIRRN